MFMGQETAMNNEETTDCCMGQVTWKQEEDIPSSKGTCYMIASAPNLNVKKVTTVVNNNSVAYSWEEKQWIWKQNLWSDGRLCLKCDGTRAETRLCLSAKRISPFKSAEGSVQSTSGRRATHISLQGLYCLCKPVFCSHVTLTGFPLHSPVSPSLLLLCITVCHHISNAVCKKLGENKYALAFHQD
jgi:hypothetical protein